MTEQEELKERLVAQLNAKHGPVLDGKAMQQLLGYPSLQALRQAHQRKQVPFPTFEIPHRKGRFALTEEVAGWLAELRYREETKA